MLKFVKLFCKYNVIIAGNRVSCFINSKIHVKSQVNCVVVVVFTKINAYLFKQIKYTKQNKNIVIETYHRKIDIVVQ
jgi:hypothetical protein